MNVTFRQLRLLEAVARNSSFTRASEELHLTQPAVSTQIKQLEEEVGMPLFEQMGKKIFLTEVGKEVYAFSRAIAQQFRDIESVLDDMKGVKRGTLALTVTSTGKYFAPYLLAAFLKRYPGTQVHLEVTNREENAAAAGQHAGHGDHGHAARQHGTAVPGLHAEPAGDHCAAGSSARRRESCAA